MQTYELTLLEKKEVAENTYSFSFQKPDDFSYHAGQYISLCVPPPEVAMPNDLMRELSLSSAPYEGIIATAMRMRNTPAKQTFAKLQPGDRVFMQGPFGEFGLDDSSGPAVMLAGGIGIVPFLSILKQALHEKSPRKFFLFFSNRHLTDAPFLDELLELVERQPQITVIANFTQERNLLQGESGYLNELLLQKHLNDFSRASFYISGPQRFVGGMWELLESLSVLDERIHGEEFTGY